MKKNYFMKKLNQSFLALSLVFCALLANNAMAQRNIGWTGAVNNNWDNAGNWKYVGFTSLGQYTTASATINLFSANNEIAVGDKVSGFGILAGTTITAIDATKKIITISDKPYNGAGTVNVSGTNVAFTFATPKNATGSPGFLDIAVISNGGNPTLTAFSTYSVAGITISNETGAIGGSTLTIPDGTEVFVESGSNEAVLIKGGNIVNNGLLDITNTLAQTTITSHTSGGFAMTFSLPSRVPTTPTEYVISGTGTYKIDTSRCNWVSGGMYFNSSGTDANNATYKLLFNNNFTPVLTAARNGTAVPSTHLFRTIGIGNLPSSKVVLGGTGFDFGSSTQGVTNGFVSASGSGVDFIIDQGTTINVFSDVNNPTAIINIYMFGETSIPLFVRNKGTFNVRGMMARTAFGMSAQNKAIVNLVNDGIFNVDVKSPSVGHAIIGISNNQGATQQADVNVINTGTMTLKNSLNGASGGTVYNMTTFGGAPNLHIINSGNLTLAGSSFNFGNKPFNLDPNSSVYLTQTGATRITNSGTLTTNQDMRATGTINTNTGIFTFASTPDNVNKLATFTVLATVAAAVGTTYKDEVGNVHTVAVDKVGGVGTALYTHVASNCINPPARTASVGPPVVLATSLTKEGAGAGDASIDYTAIATNSDGAHFQPLENSGVVNTNPGNKLMNFYDNLRTPNTTSIISPGGDNGKGRVVFGEAPGDAFSLRGTIKIQVSGATTAGVDYDFLRFPGKLDAIDISQATLDVTGIYTPTEDTTIDILTTLVDTVGSDSGAIVAGGPFASVTGLTSGWKVVYSGIIGGKVQLNYSLLSAAENEFSKFKFNYYPNPTKNQVNLSADKNISKVELYNVLGQKVQSNTVNASQKQLNIANLQKGVYFMEVSIDNAKKTFKIVKE